MKITADLSKGRLIVGSTELKITCKVRTLKEGTRKNHEVIRSIPDGLPYDPKPFPKGIWNITSVEWNEVKTVDGKEVWKFNSWEYGPVKIRTDASQMVNVWELNADGDYFVETEETVKDEADAVMLAELVEKYLDSGETVHLEVI